jgi:hypothetical protein
MKEIFKSIIGITFFVGLVQIFNSFIEMYAVDLKFLASVFNGLVFVLILMGIMISIKSGFELLKR